MCIHTTYEDAVVGMISLVPTYSIILYENIMFYLGTLSREHNQGINLGSTHDSRTNLLHSQ
jgi:hypothetical protein